MFSKALTKLPSGLFGKIAVALVVALALISLVPSPAHADGFFDFVIDPIGSTVNAAGSAILNVIATIAATLIGGMMTLISAATTLLCDVATPQGAIKTQGWDTLLTGFYSFIQSTQDRVIVPAAMQICLLVVMLRMLNITRIAESQDMTPLVSHIVVTLLMFFFGSYLVTHAGAIITIAYDLMQHMIVSIGDVSLLEQTLKIGTVTHDSLVGSDGVDLGGLMVSLLAVLLLLIASLGAVIVTMVVYWGKIIKLYIHAFFAPLAVATLFLPAVRQWGIGFIKAVASNMLALVIMVFLIALFPYVISSVVAMYNGNAADMSHIVTTIALGGLTPDNLLAILGIVVVFVLLLVFMIKSSSLAREVLGG